eukprot:gene1321-367_t
MASQETKSHVAGLEQQLATIERQLRQARDRYQEEEQANLPARINEIHSEAHAFVSQDRARREKRQRLRTELLQMQNAHERARAELAEANRRQEQMQDRQTLEKVAFLHLDRENLKGKIETLQNSVDAREKQIRAARAAREKHVALREGRLDDALQATTVLKESRSRIAQTNISSLNNLHDVSKAQQDDRSMVRTLADAVLADLQTTRRAEKLESERRIQELNEERFQIDEQLMDMQERARHHAHIRQRGAEVLVAVHENLAPPIDLLYANRDETETPDERNQMDDSGKAGLEGIGLLHVDFKEHEQQLSAIENSLTRAKADFELTEKEKNSFGYLGVGPCYYEEDSMYSSFIGKFISKTITSMADRAVDIHFQTHSDPTETNDRYNMWQESIIPSQIVNHVHRTRDLALKSVTEELIKTAVKEAIDLVSQDGIALVRSQQQAVDSILAGALQRARQFEKENRNSGNIMARERFSVPVPFDEDTSVLSGIARQMEEKYVSIVSRQEDHVMNISSDQYNLAEDDVEVLKIDNLPTYCFASKAPFEVEDDCQMIDIRQHRSWIEERNRFGKRLDLSNPLTIDASSILVGSSLLNSVSICCPPGGVFMVAAASSDGKIGVWSCRHRNEEFEPISETTPLPGSEDVVVAPTLKNWSPVLPRAPTIGLAKKFGITPQPKEIVLEDSEASEEKQVIDMTPNNFNFDPEIDLKMDANNVTQMTKSMSKTKSGLTGKSDLFEGVCADESEFPFVELVRSGTVGGSENSGSSKRKNSDAGNTKSSVKSVSFAWNGGRILVQTSHDVTVFDLAPYRNYEEKKSKLIKENGVYKLNKLLKISPKAIAQIPSNKSELTPESLRDSAVSTSCFFPRVSLFGSQDCLCLGTAGGNIAKYNMKKVAGKLDDLLRRPGVAESNKEEEKSLPRIGRPKELPKPDPNYKPKRLNQDSNDAAGPGRQTAVELNQIRIDEEKFLDDQKWKKELAEKAARQSKNYKKKEDPNEKFVGGVVRENFNGHDSEIVALCPLGPSQKEDVISMDSSGLICRWRYGEEGFSGYRHYVPVVKQRVDFDDLVLQRSIFGESDAVQRPTEEPKQPESVVKKGKWGKKKSVSIVEEKDKESDLPSSAGDAPNVPEPRARNDGQFAEPAPSRSELFSGGLPIHFDSRTGYGYYLMRSSPGAGEVVVCDLNNNPMGVSRYRPSEEIVEYGEGRDLQQGDLAVLRSVVPAAPTRSTPIPIPQDKVAQRTEGDLVSAKAVAPHMVMMYSVEDHCKSFRFIVYNTETSSLGDVKIHLSGEGPEPLYTLSHTGNVDSDFNSDRPRTYPPRNAICDQRIGGIHRTTGIDCSLRRESRLPCL